MKMKFYNVCCMIAALVALNSCGGDDKKQQAETDEKPVVTVETVFDRDVDQLGTYTASVEAEVVNNISANMANRIKQIYVDEGVRVSKGQRLVVLDDVNTTNYEIQVNNAKANLDNIKADYDRALELFKIGGGTKQAVDRMEVQLISAKNQLASAERTLRNARENTVLTSPISGIVTKRNYDPGDMTGQLPVLVIARTQPVKIVINVNESELASVRKGMPAKVTFDTYGNEVFQGTVTLTMPTVDPATRTFGVEITLPNADERILPGMFGRVELNLGNARRVVVPDRAVVKQPGSGSNFVYTYKDGKVKYNKVELGQRVGDSYELISGVEPGSQVVVTGQSRLTDGAEVSLSGKESKK